MKAIMRDEREMKDSGIEWIGEIPTTWIPTKMKSIFRNISEKNHPNAEVLSLYREYGIVPKNSRDDNHNVTSLDTASYKFVRKGNLVINKMKAWQGSLAVSDYDGIISPAYYVCEFKNKSVDKKYIHYILRSNIYAQEFERLSTGMRIGQWDLGIDDFMNIPILIPIRNEQEAIANYLDERCSKIDAIIDEAKASIEEYKELKQAVIYEAVTKGLDKNVEMKDSGIEWIGKIPKSWGTPHLSQIAYIYSGGTPNRNHPEYWNGNIPWLKTGELKNNEIFSAEEFITQDGLDNSSAIIFPENTILMAMYGQGKTRGMTAILKTPCATNQACAGILLFNDKIETDFLWICLMGAYNAIRQKAVGAGQPNLSLQLIGSFKVTMPSLAEQKSIVEYVKNKNILFEEVISEKQSLIEDLESYKKSLIYEVVTGKRKVVE